ncbi:MAG: hypothetical protein KAQ62_20905, partial [Cyclobacteriaceae bacterium]|nr:hypothetical protein [Cyclobacteriaceae bacterium]
NFRETAMLEFLSVWDSSVITISFLLSSQDTPVPELSRRTLKPHNYISYCTRNPGTIGIHGGYVYSIKCKEEVFQAFSPDSAVWLTKIVDSRPNLVYNVTIECLKADFGAKTVCIR